MAARPNMPRPIIVKKIIEAPHAGHHGGAWKVAYADFVTAMMAFFLLMWLLGATTEKQRKALADYFAPTIVQTKMESAGSNGMFGGDSIVSADDYPHAAGQTGTRSITIPRDVVGGPKEASGRESERQRFQQVAKSLMERVQSKGELKRLARNLRLPRRSKGMRIDVIDDADFSMFVIGTSQLTPEGARLFSEIAKPVAEVTNQVMIRGHTDAAPWSAKRAPTTGACRSTAQRSCATIWSSRHRFRPLFANRRGGRSRTLCSLRPIRSAQSPHLDHPWLANFMPAISANLAVLSGAVNAIAPPLASIMAIISLF
jgi:chemotaxis protein MotB